MKAPVPPVQTHQQTHLHASHSFSSHTTNRPIASVQPTTPGTESANQLKRFTKSHSEEQFHDTSQKIGSPSSFPSWKDNLKPVKPVQTPDTYAKESVENETTSGVDDCNPGGVNTIRSRFEKASSVDSTAAIRNGK